MAETEQYAEEVKMYPRFIEVHDIESGSLILLNVDCIANSFPMTYKGHEGTAINCRDCGGQVTKETYDEVKELLRSAGTAIQKGDPRIDTSIPLSMNDLCEPMMIGTPVYNSNTRAWMLVVDSALDNRSWVDLVDHCGKIVRYTPQDVVKFPLYRMKVK